MTDWTRPLQVTKPEYVQALTSDDYTQNTTAPFEMVTDNTFSPEGLLLQLAGVPRDGCGFLLPEITVGSIIQRRLTIPTAALPAWLSFSDRNELTWRHTRGDSFEQIAAWLQGSGVPIAGTPEPTEAAA